MNFPVAYEGLSRAGSSKKLNEDSYITPHNNSKTLVAVIDGVSSLSQQNFPEFGGRTSGQWASDTLTHYLQNLNRTDKKESVLEILLQADAYFYHELPKELQTEEKAWERPAAAMFIVLLDKTRNRMTWAQVADCIGVVTTYSHPEPILLADDPMKRFDLPVLQEMVEKNLPITHETIRAKLIANRQKRNQPGEYPVVDGSLNPSLVRSGTMKLDEIKSLALFTDGLFSYDDNLATVGQHLTDNGIDSWYSIVEAREAADSTCRNPLRFNNDDKTAIVVK